MLSAAPNIERRGSDEEHILMSDEDRYYIHKTCLLAVGALMVAKTKHNDLDQLIQNLLVSAEKLK